MGLSDCSFSHYLLACWWKNSTSDVIRDQNSDDKSGTCEIFQVYEEPRCRKWRLNCALTFLACRNRPVDPDSIVNSAASHYLKVNSQAVCFLQPKWQMAGAFPLEPFSFSPGALFSWSLWDGLIGPCSCEGKRVQVIVFVWQPNTPIFTILTRLFGVCVCAPRPCVCLTLSECV